MRVAIIAAAGAITACSHGGDPSGVAGSGTGNSRTYAVDGFSAIAATGPDDVDVRIGSGFSIRAEGDPAALDRLVIARNGDTLEVRRKSGFGWGSTGHAKIFVTMPRITAVDLTGSGGLAIDHVDGSAFRAGDTGSGELSIGSLAVGTLDLSLTGSGSISAAGTANSGRVSIAGSGDIDAPRLTMKQADVHVAGSGGLTAAVSGPASVAVLGSGDVTLTGGAKCTTSKLGSGGINCS